MKPSISPPPHPRVRCQMVRFWSALRSDDSPLPRHLQTCEACRQFVVSTQQLHAGLRQAALLSASTPPHGMERRIMDTVRFSPAPCADSSASRFLSFAAAGGAVAFTLVGLWHFNLTPFADHSGSTSEYSAEVATLVAAVRSLPDNLSQKIAVPTVQLAQDNSLNREVEKVYSDARSALDFVALNFLPGSDANEAAGGLIDALPQPI